MPIPLPQTFLDAIATSVASAAALAALQASILGATTSLSVLTAQVSPLQAVADADRAAAVTAATAWLAT